MKKMEFLDKEDFPNWDIRYKRIQKKKDLRINLKTAFHYRAADVWSRLDKETVRVTTVHKQKTKLDATTYKDKTPQPQLPFP